MNFDVYKINKIFYDCLSSFPERHKYGFNYWGVWDDPKRGYYFGIALNWRNESVCHWNHHSSSFDLSSYLRKRYSFYQIDQNRIMNQKEDGYYFSINGAGIEVSLRELILFIIYMKYLSCV